MVQDDQKEQPFTIQTNTFLGSVYAQIVGVTVTDIDITLEFVYKHPRKDVKEAQVVARVTLPRNAGKDLAKTILDIINIHESKKKGEKND